MAGTPELLPDGWMDQTPDIVSIPGTPKRAVRVYALHPVNGMFEGPGRIMLVESFEQDDDYFQDRINESRARGGAPVAVIVCAEPTKVWVDAATGELVLGWTDRDKRDVLVANAADFTVQQLVDVAERVHDCCG